MTMKRKSLQRNLRPLLVLFFDLIYCDYFGSDSRRTFQIRIVLSYSSLQLRLFMLINISFESFNTTRNFEISLVQTNDEKFIGYIYALLDDSCPV